MIVCEEVHEFFLDQAELTNAFEFCHNYETCETWDTWKGKSQLFLKPYQVTEKHKWGQVFREVFGVL